MASRKRDATRRTVMVKRIMREKKRKTQRGRE